MDIQYLSGAGNSTGAGVFIPAANLHGVSAGELNSANTALLEGKFLYGFLNALLLACSEQAPLGFVGFSKTTSDGGINVIRETVSFTLQWVADYKLNSIYALPIPETGSYADLGGLSLAGVFPDCELVTLGAGCPGEGVVIYHTVATNNGGTVPASELEDARGWLMGALLGLAAGVTLRSATVASAVRSATNLLRQRITGVTFPDTYASASNPLTGISVADIPHLRLLQEPIALEIELEINSQTQTLDVKVATN